MTSKKTVQRHGFRTGESIVYPAHGVGKIIDIEEQEVAGMKLELFVITFEKDKMTLRVPVAKATSVGMRKLADEATVGRAFETVRGRARVKRTMWSRRAQEYEAKINSGDLIAISEVVRDLYRSQAQPEPSYSERQLYEQAIDRMSREVAVVEKITETEAVTQDREDHRGEPAAQARRAARGRGARTRPPEDERGLTGRAAFLRSLEFGAPAADHRRPSCFRFRERSPAITLLPSRIV